jgi:hypothetical protein
MEITFDMLVAEVAKAAKKSFLELFKNGERYCYCTLQTTGDTVASPFISAWSLEALEREGYSIDDDIKWSYADSPYCFFGKENFTIVDELFEQLPHIDDFWDADAKGFSDDWDEWENFRLRTIVEALKQIDAEGIFALNQPRKDVYVNVEMYSESNIERALIFNKAEDIAEWLKYNRE